MATGENPEVAQLIPVNLATVCLEGFLYGLFFILYVTSTYLLVRQGQQRMAAEGLRFRTNSVYRAPMFIAAHIIFLTVTGHWVLTVYRLFQAFVNYRGGTQAIFYYANIAFASEVAKTALLVLTVLISDATIIYRLYIIWSYNKLIILPPLLTWCGLIGISGGVCWRFSQYKLGDAVYTGPLGHWITADGLTTLVTNVYCSACISYRVFRARRLARRHPSLASPNLLSALAILVESAALHTAWNALFLASFLRALPFQFTAIDLWSPTAGIAFMLINLRVALGWAQRAHPSRGSSAPGAGLGQQMGPLAGGWKRSSYGFGADSPSSPLGPFGPTTAYTAHPQRTHQNARFSYVSDRDPTRGPERLSYTGPHADTSVWQDQPWVAHATQPHPYALAASEGRAEGDARPPIHVSLDVGVTRAVNRASGEEKSGWSVGEAV